MDNPYLDQARELLRKFYGYQDFRPAQRPVVESLLSGQDTVAIMPTGAGKSICFQLPALVFPGITLVISPLISLMKDQVDSLLEQGVPATYINSQLSLDESQQRLAAIAAGRYKLIYVAPE
ncbi:MAG: DEAD/DEAH box helicase, partial [Selenomonas sp.]|nr:DEAD/DEAH box helicase [Selenomonas sp.]